MFVAFASSIDKDQTAPEGAAWSGSILLGIQTMNKQDSITLNILIGQKVQRMHGS